MSQANDHVFDAAMHMSEEDRVALVGRLLATMPDREIGLSLESLDLLNELDRRFADCDGDVPWTELRAEH